MKQLETLMNQLEEQATWKKDMLVKPTNLHFANGNLYVVQGVKEVEYEPTAHFHNQIAEKLSIPKQYYTRLQQKALHLLDENVNHWLHHEQKTRLIRTFEKSDANIARAFLSNSYSIIDNMQVLIEALEAIKQSGLEVEIVDAELSETRMYLKVICPAVEVEAVEMLRHYRLALERGTTVVSGFVLQNSEIGAGAFQIMPRGVVLACKNGMVNVKDALRSVHLGARLDTLDFSKNEAVKAANLKLIKEQVKHAVKVFLSEGYLNKLIDFYTKNGTQEIQAPVANCIEVIAKNYSITEERKANLLNYFIKQGDQRRIGLVNALTEEAQTQTPDIKHETETIAFDVLANFNRIETAAFRTKFTTN